MEEEFEDNGLIVSSDIWSMLGLRWPMVEYEVNEALFEDFGERIRLCLHYYNKAIRWRRKIDERIDLRSCVLNLAAAVEGIVNESIVQYVRMKMGVKMPEYYCQWAEEKKDIRIRTTKKSDVNLNKFNYDINRSKKLMVVSLGDLGEVMHTMKHRGMYIDDELMRQCYDDELILTLKRIAKIRGEAAHGGKIEDVEAFERMTCLYREFEKYVDIIKDLRKKCC